MTFLPVVERELRVASRKKLTYWSRLAASGSLLMLFGIMVLFLMFGNGQFAWTPGQMLFTVLKWPAFGFAVLWGVFFAVDTLSEEKREGTLGLLFLTDLRGYDIVLGKMIPLWLRSFYGLLAVFPVLALPMMMGGVAGNEFSRSVLVICNTLFLSLSIGMMVSSMSKEVMKALNATILLNVIFLIGLPWADMWRAHWDPRKWKAFFSIASPGYLFAWGPYLRPSEFWKCAIVQFCIPWAFLAVACVIVPRTWKEKPNSKKRLFASLFSRWRFGGKQMRVRFRRRLLSRAPILWLALRDRWMARFNWLVTLLALAFLAWDIHWHWKDWNSQRQWDGGPLQHFNAVADWLYFGLIIWISSQACRFYVEACRSGAMELILVTPMQARDLVRDQWKALWRTFLFSVLVVLGLWVTSGVHFFLVTWSENLQSNQQWVNAQLLELANGWVNGVGRLMALAWFGMWMGLTTRKVSLAVLKTILFVCLLPWLMEGFIWMGTEMIFQKVFGGIYPRSWLWEMPVATFEFVKNVLFIVLARWILMTRFRQIVARTKRAPRFRLRAVPPPLPSPAPKPLVT